MEKQQRKILRAVVVLASLLALLPAVQAIAIAPATIEIEPGTLHEVELHIINNEQKTTEILLYKKGGLASYFDLPEETITLGPNQIKIVKLKIGLPESAAGTARIGAKENPKANQIGAVAAVESILTAGGAHESGRGAAQEQQIPAIELLSVQIRKSGDASVLEISVANRGNAGIDAYAEAKIEADTGAGSIKTDSEFVWAGKEETLTAELDSVLAKASDYKIDAVVYFGKSSVKKSVRVSAGITGSAVTDVPASPKLDFLLIAAIVFVIIIDAAVFAWRKVRDKKL